MTGYTRQSTSEIVADEPMSAAPVAAEFDALAGAFNAATGHSHSGASGEGPKISYNDLLNKPTVATLASTTPAALAASGTVGVGTTAARADHVHAYPTAAAIGAAATSHTHTNASSGAAGFMSAADKTKLDGIATAAQAGTVTSVSAGTGMSFTSITTTGSIAIDTAVVARLTATNDFGENIVKNLVLDDVGSTVQALGSVSGAQSVSIATGRFITLTVPNSQTTTITFTGTMAGKAHRVMLLATMSGSASVLAFTNDRLTGGGSIPITPTGSGANSTAWGTGVHLVECVTFDGGSNWYVFRHIAVGS